MKVCLSDAGVIFNQRSLFRGKIENGQWVIGFLKQQGREAFIEVPMLNGTNETHKVDYKTIGQCTGIIDVNGEMIFEGDFVKFATYFYPEGTTEMVRWDDMGMWLPFRDGFYTDDEQGDWFTSPFEIVGNKEDIRIES